MPSSPNALEQKGAALFDNMGLSPSWGLNHVRLIDINPEGAYATGEHLEVDYLIPLDNICLVGEITDRAAGSCPKKLKVFRRHINAIDQALKSAKTQAARRALWEALGVESGDQPRFRNVRRVVGFAILTKIEKCEIPLQEQTENCVVLYRYHWDLLQEYATTIGPWARHPFVDMFDLPPKTPSVSRPLQFKANSRNLLAECDRYVTADRQQTSHVVTFIASPYDLLPCATVCRRDALPSLGTEANQRYQRTLFVGKLVDIRTKLLNHKKFIFPNSILAVLSKDCSFDSADKILEIPDVYGALNVVDGQHRLFSYADDAIKEQLKDDAKIVVTAVVFDSVDDEYIDRFSARTFIEINTNQTRVSSLHLFGIGYEVLGHTNHRYLAAHILRKVNERANPLRGLLRTSDSPRGKIKSMEIVGSLGVLTNIDKMDRFADAKGAAASRRRQGFENLFGAPVKDLSDAVVMTRQGVFCLERYFRIVAKVFKHDWPKVGPTQNTSALSLTKFFAALMRLLRQFTDEGATWETVESELEKIRDNVKQLRSLTRYQSVLFKQDHAKIPDASARISDMFRFLNANRKNATSIAKIMKST